jgi:hypothetical protein
MANENFILATSVIPAQIHIFKYASSSRKGIPPSLHNKLNAYYKRVGQITPIPVMLKLK